MKISKYQRKNSMSYSGGKTTPILRKITKNYVISPYTFNL